MESPTLTAQIARAIVHLNFDEPDQARHLLFEVLTELTFPPAQAKEPTDGHAAA